MIYLLFAIAGFMSIITAYILNIMVKSEKNKLIHKILVVGISFVLFVLIAIYLIHQKTY